MSEIFIQELEIKKIRHLENININISKVERKHLILTGKNGSGKTTVLNSLKEYLKSIEDNIYHLRGAAYEEVRELEEQLSKFSLDPNYIKSIKDAVVAYKNTINHYGNGIELKISNHQYAQEAYYSGDFILAHFGAKRNVDIELPKGVEKVDLNSIYKIENTPSQQILKYLVDLKTQQSFARNEGDINEVNKITLWFERFEQALKDLMGCPELQLKFDYKNYNFSIIENEKIPYGFNDLSDGYSAILDIVMDLIMRMESKASRVYDLQGIVLIDEIETHLHIELQKKILPFLVEFFPNIQFIITTHSPFVINSIDNTVIYDLEKKIKVEDLSAYSYEGIIENYFDTDQYSQEIKDKLVTYESLINKNNKSDDDLETMYDLQKYFKSIPQHVAPELVARFLELELNRRTNS